MTQQPDEPDRDDLADACARWQSGREESSRLRGAARVLTGIPHYFDAEFITAHETAAREDPTALRDARAILKALASSPVLTASQWSVRTGLPDVDFAGRGLKSAPQDEAIERRLSTGWIDMPLWGLSLNRATTEQYGGRFLLQVVGPFPAVPAWLASGVKAEEQELISGGRYRVVKVTPGETVTHVNLEWVEQLVPDPAAGAGVA